MIARIQKSMKEKEQGFTLIELLVVMIIIGILAAIAIPVFLNQRAKARDTAVKADVSTVGKEVATFYVDHLGAVPVVTIGTNRYVLNSPAAAAGNTGTAVANGDLGATSANVTGVAVTGSSDTVWCVQLTYTGGTATTIGYSALAGMGQPGSTCSAAGVRAP